VSRRSLTTAATLVVLVGVLCVMAVWGYRAATAPMEDSSGQPSSGPTCDPADQKVAKYLRRADVTVSVYNSGRRSGRAVATLDQLEQAGFRPGEVGNAPDGITVRRAAVYTTKDDDPAAELVARALGGSTQVVHAGEELGPGVDVVIGDKFERLDPKAPRKIELPQPEVTCD
jgi:hypothetical protein